MKCPIDSQQLIEVGDIMNVTKSQMQTLHIYAFHDLLSEIDGCRYDFLSEGSFILSCCAMSSNHK